MEGDDVGDGGGIEALVRTYVGELCGHLASDLGAGSGCGNGSGVKDSAEPSGPVSEGDRPRLEGPIERHDKAIRGGKPRR